MKRIDFLSGGTMLAFLLTFMSINVVQAAETKSVTLPVGASAMTVVEDKETGELRPATAEEIAAMKASPSALKSTLKRGVQTSKSAGEMQHYKNGMKSLELDASSFETLRATENTDGSLSLHHGETAQPVNKKSDAAEQ